MQPPQNTQRNRIMSLAQRIGVTLQPVRKGRTRPRRDGVQPRAEWLRDAAWRRADALAAWRAGASVRRIARMLGVDRRTVGRYLAGWCERPTVKRDRKAVRPYRAAIEASRARRGARGERRPGAWTADHERRRAVAVLVLLAAPWATHGSVAAAVGRSRRTV